MNELMVAVALWCGQVLVHSNVYIKSNATPAQVDQCRQELLKCLDRFAYNSPEQYQCYINQKLPGGK